VGCGFCGGYAFENRFRLTYVDLRVLLCEPSGT